MRVKQTTGALTLMAMAVLVLLAPALAGGFKVSAPPPYEQGELLVKFDEGVTPERAAEIIEANGSVAKRTVGEDLYLVSTGASRTVEEAVRAFSRAEGVKYAEPNYTASK